MHLAKQTKDAGGAGARRTQICVAATCVGLLLILGLPVASANAAFGIESFNIEATAEGGEAPATAAGSHPYSLITEIAFNHTDTYPDGDLRDLEIDLPPGMIENSTALPRCSAERFATPRSSPFEASLSGESCPDNTQIGIVTLTSARAGGETRTFGVFNLAPPSGFPSRLGFAPYGTPITIAPRVREANLEFGLTLRLRDFSQQLGLSAMRLAIWGAPWALSHSAQRGDCLNEAEPGFGYGKCRIDAKTAPHDSEAYLTLPTSCDGVLTTRIRASSWQGGSTAAASSTAAPLQGCAALAFDPVPSGVLTTDRTSSPSGYVFSLEGNSAALLNPRTPAHAQVRKAVLTLPEGMTINPSVASGLGTCTEPQFAAETLGSAAGEGCPNASKVGELTLESPLLEDRIKGEMFFATPRENRFGTLLALYLVARSPERGIIVKVAGKVVSDPATGRLTTTFDDLPQLPYAHFDVHFREGQRSPLATPAACGNYVSEVDTTPWGDPGTLTHQISPFVLKAGIGGGPCPPGTLAAFAPAAEAGSLNSNASSYTPFYLHLFRADSDQEITSYSAQLPPGLLGRISGIPFCPEAAIAAAKLQTGAESADAPACPAASLIGHTYTGYGVGGALAYAPGTLYLAGPYHGSPLSIVAIDSAKVGPFDLGTVVIRSAIHVDRRSAQVAIDSAGSDPIPHILAGFPLRLRDIRVYVDRPGFTVNPTSCDPFSVLSTLTGAGPRFDDPADDSFAAAPVPYQASNCSALGFAPRIGLRLAGGHTRGDAPSLIATVRPRPGDSGIAAAKVILPPKIFLAQEHLDSVCTPRQFAARDCPPGSVYGHASALTPLLEEPMRGPVYLRTNNSETALPDLVAVLSGRGVEIELLGRIDSHLGGLRATFEALPDAPLTRFTMRLRGGERGIVENATDVCAHPQRARASFLAQDNSSAGASVAVRAKCPKQKKAHGGRKGGRR